MGVIGAVGGDGGGGIGAEGMASLAAGSIGAYATGGSFTVGGSGGTDTTPVQFMATPGERVTVETPRQRAESQNQGNGAAPPTIINVIDPSVVHAALRTPEGRQTIVNVIRAEMPHMR